MTEKMFFDTDCLSSFLMVGREDIILNKFKGHIILPQFVYYEFCRPCVNHLRLKIDNMIAAKLIVKMEIYHGTEESNLFRELTRSPRAGNPVIGKGEASALVLAQANNGIIASNNLRDVKKYAQEFHLTLVTTADILVDAFIDAIIDETEANRIWADMLKKLRKLPAISFSEYLRMIEPV